MPLEYPEQSYYPAAKLRLIIRFDEFGQASRLPAAPKKTTKNLNGVKDDRADLVPIQDPQAPEGVKRYVLVPAGQTTAQPGTEQKTSTDNLTFDVTLIPKDMDVGINGIRTADTMNATFRYPDIPIDPRVVRSCAVEAFVGTLTPQEFQAGVQGQLRAGTGEPLCMVPDTYLGPDGKQRSNSRFKGWVDKWTVEWTDKGEATVRIECRDNTELLLEQERPPKLVLDMNKGIDEAIALYLSHFPQMQGLSIQYYPAGDTPPKLKDVLQGTAYRPQLGPPPAKGGGAGTGQKISVWDYLTDVVGSIGHVIRVDGTVLYVQSVRSLTTRAIVRRPDDPFIGRTLATGTQIDYRRFIYGRNIQEMRISRNFSSNTPTNVEVRCYNGAQKKVLVARFPLPDDRLKYAIPGDAQPDQKWTVYRVSGIGDNGTLRVVAQSIYESLGRNELSVEVKTRNLASFGGGNLDPDILDMKAGDTFEILVNRDDVESATLTRLERSLTSYQLNAEQMKARGFSSEFSDAYAKAYTDAGFLTQFRLKTFKIGWSTDGGVDLSLQGVNYIEARSDKSSPNEPGTSVTTSKNKPKPVNNQLTQ